ncbi:MAG: FkbM family methyltransferase [Bacteriovorax sp.]
MFKKMNTKLDEIKYIFNRKLKGPTPLEMESMRWVNDKGDELLRLNYDLDESSLVWDLGGYRGDFAAEIFCKYCSRVKVFEPIPEFDAFIKNRFLKNKYIENFQYGLGYRNEVLHFGVTGDKTSSFIQENTIQAPIRDVVEYFNECNSPTVDLIKINIEGGEYELLEKMIEAQIIKNFKNLQIQFHNFVPDAENRYNKLTEALSRTHTRTWCYKFIWENWEIKR